MKAFKGTKELQKEIGVCLSEKISPIQVEKENFSHELAKYGPEEIKFFFSIPTGLFQKQKTSQRN